MIMKKKRKSELVKTRFYKQAMIMDSGCIEWQGSISQAGYGQISIDCKSVLVHRLSWNIFNGKIPKGLFICHKCDNPKCCNPDHLFLGTPKDNMQDAWAKGRMGTPKSMQEMSLGIKDHIKGEKHSGSKLKEKHVREILVLNGLGVKDKELGVKFGVSHSTINDVIHNRTWKHINREVIH